MTLRCLDLLLNESFAFLFDWEFSALTLVESARIFLFLPFRVPKLINNIISY
jgi:hypothetical protein